LGDLELITNGRSRSFAGVNGISIDLLMIYRIDLVTHAEPLSMGVICEELGEVMT